MKKDTEGRDIFIALVVGLIVAIALALFGCKSQPPQTQVAIETKETVIERLVPYALPADSAAIRALFECDSLNNVRLVELSEQKGGSWQSRYLFGNGLFSWNLYQPPDTVYVPAKDSIIEREKPVEVVREVPVHYTTSWEKIRMKLGDLFLIILGVGFISLLIRWKK